MKKISLFVFAFLLTFSLFAQIEKGYIYLKDGTILKGKYQFADDLEKLKVISSGNIWIFDSEEVDSVTTRRSRRTNEFNQSLNENRLFFRTSIGFLAGNSENSQSAPFSFTGSVNYPVTPKISVGVGAGVEFLKESYLPTFVNIEYKLRNAEGTPYFFVLAGYQVPLEDSQQLYYDYYPMWSSFWPGPEYSREEVNAKGGFLVNPGIGYTQMFSPGFGMSVAFGYRYHRLNYNGEEDYQLDIDFNRLSVKLGILFN